MHVHLHFLIPAIVLLGALFNGWPDGYFQIMRWITCAFAVSYALCAYGKRHLIVIFIFAGIAVLFNPLRPINLSRDVWVVTYGATALFFIIYGIALARKR